MIQYLDMTQVKGCFGVIPENGEVIVLTGVSVNSMPLSVKRKEGEAYDDFARKYGIYFIFDDCIPEIDFYTVPKIEVAATDNVGGLGSVRMTISPLTPSSTGFPSWSTRSMP